MNVFSVLCHTDEALPEKFIQRWKQTHLTAKSVWFVVEFDHSVLFVTQTLDCVEFEISCVILNPFSTWAYWIFTYCSCQGCAAILVNPGSWVSLKFTKLISNDLYVDVPSGVYLVTWNPLMVKPCASLLQHYLLMPQVCTRVS